MRLALMTEPQLGGSYEDLSFAARAAEEAGFDGFARSDHYFWTGDPGLSTTDALITMAGLARETKRVRLTVLVSPITFRHPAVLAKSAASLDEMTGGRFELGVGTGWMEAEHDAFGLPFPPWKERFARMEEALQYLRAAFAGGSFEGQFYNLNGDAQLPPRRIRLLVGGSGSEKTPTLAGRFADEYNHFTTAPEKLAPKIEVMRDAARAAGRNPDDITVSIMGPALLAANEKRHAELLEKVRFRKGTVADLEEEWNARCIPHGTPERAAEAFAAYAAVGVTKYYIQWLDLPDRAGIMEQVELAAGMKL